MREAIDWMLLIHPLDDDAEGGEEEAVAIIWLNSDEKDFTLLCCLCFWHYYKSIIIAGKHSNETTPFHLLRNVVSLTVQAYHKNGGRLRPSTEQINPEP